MTASSSPAAAPTAGCGGSRSPPCRPCCSSCSSRASSVTTIGTRRSPPAACSPSCLSSTLFRWRHLSHHAVACYGVALIAAGGGAALLRYPEPSPGLADWAAALLTIRASLQHYRLTAAALARAVGSRFAFCDLRGPTDLIAYRQEIVFANALPWRPRPVFQSYAAYTPDLLRDNAEH